MRTTVAAACVVGAIAGWLVGVSGSWGSPAVVSAQQPGPALDVLRAAVAAVPEGRFARPVSYDAATAEQQAYIRAILEGPRNALSGPLAAMIVSPQFGDLAQRTMAYARFAGTDGAGSVPPRLNELAILMAARWWSSEYVWNAHARYAVRMGLASDVVEAIRTGGRPAGMEPDVAAVHALLTELLETRRVSDATFASAKSALGGDRQLLDLVGTFAVYAMTAVLTVVDDTAMGPDYVPQLPPVSAPAR